MPYSGAKSKFPVTEKLGNGVLITPTQGSVIEQAITLINVIGECYTIY